MLSLPHCECFKCAKLKCLLSTAYKGTEKKLSELQGVREKAESELHEKVRNLEKELENSNTRLADFKRRGNAQTKNLPKFVSVWLKSLFRFFNHAIVQDFSLNL